MLVPPQKGAAADWEEAKEERSKKSKEESKEKG
jgi:hypothetical protein